jgi:hypothetical protein
MRSYTECAARHGTEDSIASPNAFHLTMIGSNWRAGPFPPLPLSPFETSAPLKVELLLRRLVDAGQRPMRLETSGYNRGTA